MSFEEVFNGETAKNFRESLKKGVLPILSCARCGELVTTKTNNCYEQVSLPHRGIMIETNGSCNLACLSCGRQIRKLRSVKMSVHDLRKVLNQLKEFNLEKIHLYALGEPFLSNDIYDAMKTIREIMPSVYITTSTNGMLIDSRDRYLAALLMDNIVFSIDGPSQEICEKYQVGIDFRKAYENMCRLAELRDENHARRPYLVWKYVVFRWNDRAEHLRDTIRLARNAKVDAIAFWFTKSPFYGMSLRFFVNDNWRKVAPLINNRRVLYFRYDPGIHL
jgi:MoaA/NifB/PqqE/SkfB family radical SAM enzyme